MSVEHYNKHLADIMSAPGIMVLDAHSALVAAGMAAMDRDGVHVGVAVIRSLLA